MMKQKPNADIVCAETVLATQIEGLYALKASLGASFAHATQLLASVKGRIIVSGMGKSGHVARKIAATMASTGTPAYFVHPGEASHGDLGMITKDDGVLALSNSGETAELADIIAYTRRFSIPLVGMVRRASSRLVEAADVALVLPEIPEASPVNAPTTSTTMMMALGDAIAMALLERKGFGKEEFGVFHPGGKLGKAFIKVEDLMHIYDAVPLVSADDTMDKVLLTMTAKSFGCAGVIDAAEKLIGVITDGDLRRHMSGRLINQHAKDIMNENPYSIRKSALAAEALGIMNSKSITSLFVVADEKPIGILHIHDCLRAGVM